MKRFYKITDGNGNLRLVGIGEGGKKISKEEYDTLLEEIKNTPFVMPEIVEEEEATDG